ncbi:unnamed protein product, partial [Ectocarpus sp. 12 AP-2014]
RTRWTFPLTYHPLIHHHGYYMWSPTTVLLARLLGRSHPLFPPCPWPAKTRHIAPSRPCRDAKSMVYMRFHEYHRPPFSAPPQYLPPTESLNSPPENRTTAVWSLFWAVSHGR